MEAHQAEIAAAVRPRFETPYERSGVLVPGLPVLAPGVERHPIAGGGSCTVPIRKGDEICVLDIEGLQPVEIAFFAADGRSDAAMIGARGGAKAGGLVRSMLEGDPSGQRTLSALGDAGCDLGRADVVRAFAHGSRPGDMETFHAERDGILVVGTPAKPMEPHEQDVPTEVALYVRRAAPLPGPEPLRPPAPLADPLEDLNVLPGHAKAYVVRAGEHIQVLDIQGRQCSDFQALPLRALERGVEREISTTATRSLTGSLYPVPGLLGKFFSEDLEPLVEVVQDTCGRHDTFGLACTARYYEDKGYPGHVSCTENINASLAPHGVGARGGWPAINFFFNTSLDDRHAIGLDDPWTRPGDYVLMRALTDLVCVSTSCPSDIDATNGWNPTDIQVRVYGKERAFRRSVGWRKTPGDHMRQTRETGFHRRFARHTRDFVETNGYWLPRVTTDHGTVAEYWACREKAAVMDLSSLRKCEVIGPDAERLMHTCVTRDMRRLSVGQVVYTAMCYRHGGMVDDGTVFRLGDSNFRWIGGADAGVEWLREQARGLGLDVWVRESTPQLCNIAVQGRLAREILAAELWTPPAQPTVDELGWFRFTVARLGDYHGPACVLSRTGFTGELGYELFCHPKDAERFFDAVWERGAPMGMLPLGMDALETLRVEAGLALAGREFCDQTDPFEAGIGFTVPAAKQGDFIGREALEERRAHPRRRLVGLEVGCETVPAPGSCVHVGRAQVGEVTSAVRSPVLGKVVALARIDVAHAGEEAGIEIGQLDGHQKRLPARLTPFPHFDPGKRRVRGDYA